MDYFFHILNLSAINIILAVSLNLILGYGGMASMAHAAFFGIGGYITALAGIHLGYNFIFILVTAMVVSGFFGSLLAIPFIRVRNEYLILFTVAFQMVVYHLMTSCNKITGGDTGLSGIPRPDIFGIHFRTELSYLPLFLIFTVVFYYIALLVTKSPFGRVIIGLREDEKAIASLGKNILKFKVTIFMIGTSIAAGAGGLFVYYLNYVNPITYNLDVSILIIAMVVLGGTANLLGSAVGAFLLTVIPELLGFIPCFTDIIAPIRQCIYGSLLILFMRFRPEGLIPEYFHLKTPKSHFKKIEKLSNEVKVFSNKSKLSIKKDVDHEEKILDVIGISKSFGGLQAVKDFSLPLYSGQITALVGPNGCGKTTAFNVITGYLTPDEGEILFKGKRITNAHPYILPKMGIVRSWQDVRIFQGMTVLDNVLVAKQDQSGEAISKYFFMPWKVSQEENDNLQQAIFHLTSVGLKKKASIVARDLSYAEQKLLAIARLLSTGAQAILLDEPSSGIDPTWVKNILKLIRNISKLGKTICIIEHNLDIVKEISDIVYFMAQGRIIAKGSAEELMSDPKLGMIYFGT